MFNKDFLYSVYNCCSESIFHPSGTAITFSLSVLTTTQGAVYGVVVVVVFTLFIAKNTYLLYFEREHT